MTEPIIIPSNKLGNLFYAVISFLFVFVGFFMCLIPDILIQFIGVIAILFYGLCFVTFLKRIVNKTPILLINDLGVSDHSTAIAIGFIPWQDIEAIQLTSLFNQTFISISVKDQQSYLKKMTVLQRLTTKANLKMGYPLINITLNTTGQKPEKVMEEIERQFEGYY